MSSTRATGIALAFVTALISGVAIFVNGHAVRHFGDATVYTTAKNAVAGVLLLALAAPLLGGPRSEVPTIRKHRLGLAAIAVIGGSVPFVLFFEGLARAEATQAAFIQKTLIVWVALLAVPLLTSAWAGRTSPRSRCSSPGRRGSSATRARSPSDPARR